MRSLAAAISPGDFGFTDWAFAAEAQSEMAVQVAIVTRKNNALIIIFLSISPVQSPCPQHIRQFEPLSEEAVPEAGVMAITKLSS
jgi:hypothetical protein